MRKRKSKTRSKSPKRKLTRAIYSPTVKTEWHTVQRASGTSFQVQVVRDDLLPGGTKQRGLVPLLRSMPEREFIMPAANDGLGQVALAYSAGLLGKSATIVVAARAKETKATALARKFRGKIIAVRPGYMTVRKARARAYTDSKNKARSKTARLFELGVNEPEFEQALLSELKMSLPKNFRAPKRVWIAVGSGLLMRVLGKLWPDTILMGLEVGMRQSAVDILGKDRAKKSKIFIEGNYKFESATKDLPPWPSMPTYDGKLWSWIKRYGRQGDLVWNVGIDTLHS